MKKVLSFALVLVLVCSLTVAALAADFGISVDETLVEPGDTVTVTITVDEEYSDTILQFELSYDWDVLTYASHTLGDDYSDITCTVSKKSAVVKLSWIDLLGNSRTMPAGTVATVVFTANETTTLNQLELSLKSKTGSGETITEDPISITVCPGHSYEAAVTTPGTCVSKAVITHTCVYCGVSYNEDGEIDTANHVNLAHVEAVEPNCTEAGNIEHWYCGDCGCYYADAECTVLTDAESLVIPALGHSYEGETTVPGTCCTPAAITYTCSVCGDSYEGEGEYDTANHTQLEHQAYIAPTCTETGLNEFWYCNGCGCMWSNEECTQVTNYPSQIIPATGHTDGEPVVENKVPGASCTTAGTYDRVTYCVDCGVETGRTEVPYYAEGSTVMVTVSAAEGFNTAMIQGELTYDDAYLTCTKVEACSSYADLTTVISTRTPVVKFNWLDLTGAYADFPADDMVVVTFLTTQDVDADALNGLLSVSITINSGAVSGNVSAVVYHALDEGEYTAATCTTDAYTTYHCTVCDETIVKVEEGTALGHTHGQEVIENEVASTSSAEGHYDVVVYCTVCGDELSRTTVYTRMIGDVNFDHSVDIADAMLLIQYYNETIDLDADALSVADLNGDEEVDLADVNLLLKFYNEDIDKFPIEE